MCISVYSQVHRTKIESLFYQISMKINVVVPCPFSHVLTIVYIKIMGTISVLVNTYCFIS